MARRDPRESSSSVTAVVAFPAVFRSAAVSVPVARAVRTWDARSTTAADAAAAATAVANLRRKRGKPHDDDERQNETCKVCVCVWERERKEINYCNDKYTPESCRSPRVPRRQLVIFFFSFRFFFHAVRLALPVLLLLYFHLTWTYYYVRALTTTTTTTTTTAHIVLLSLLLSSSSPLLSSSRRRLSFITVVDAIAAAVGACHSAATTAPVERHWPPVACAYFRLPDTATRRAHTPVVAALRVIIIRSRTRRRIRYRVPPAPRHCFSNVSYVVFVRLAVPVSAPIGFTSATVKNPSDVITASVRTRWRRPTPTPPLLHRPSPGPTGRRPRSFAAGK